MSELVSLSRDGDELYLLGADTTVSDDFEFSNGTGLRWLTWNCCCLTGDQVGESSQESQTRCGSKNTHRDLRKTKTEQKRGKREKDLQRQVIEVEREMKRVAKAVMLYMFRK